VRNGIRPKLMRQPHTATLSRGPANVFVTVNCTSTAYNEFDYIVSVPA
jgi:hypothetical protein